MSTQLSVIERRKSDSKLASSGDERSLWDKGIAAVSSFCFPVLGIKPRTFCMLGKWSTTELYPQLVYCFPVLGGGGTIHYSTHTEVNSSHAGPRLPFF